MVTIITSSGNSLKSKFDLRFGRTSWFCVYNSANNSVQFIENEFKNADGGAGTKAAETIAEQNAEQVISGDFGPKAKALLEKLNIQMVILDEPQQTVGGILEKITKNEKQQ
jgi:predicted Fe-Mo cluster-binding NifX family protein